MKVPYFNYPHVFTAQENEFLRILKDVGSRGAFIMQEDLQNFEQRIADYCGSKYAVAVNSATSALHLACLALNLKKDDILWASPVTFVASVNCGLYCGASIDFVDINIENYNICHKKLKTKLKEAQVKNLLPKIVIVTHLAGHSANMYEIKKLSRKVYM